MRILLISFYFEPDLSAGSFRNTALFKELLSRMGKEDFIHVITTQPNRYDSYKLESKDEEKGENYIIKRIRIPKHKSGMVDQAKSYITFFREAIKLTENENYDLVYTSSSRLFSSFLGRRISAKKNIPLYLDIRDIFVDSIKDIFGTKKIIQIPVVLFARCVENYSFKNAKHINLVSEGFRDYFRKYKNPTFSFYTNGIDDVFINLEQKDIDNNPEKIIITYAGNIGSGQGLEKIIPQAAKKLGNKYLFRVIGDGGTKGILEDKIKELGVDNIEILKPVKRDELIKYYQKSHYLFLHLNDLEAFKKVLPSKLFEYGAFNKPIIAGVAGYAAEFVSNNLTNYILFNPTDVDDFVNQLNNFEIKYEYRNEFISKYSRLNITKQLADSIINISVN
ncbi:MAG: glycosyltransferase family 4 protein [Bacteroidales bacterium]